MIKSPILKYDLGHFDGSLLHFLFMFLLSALLRFDFIHQAVSLALLNELKLGYHTLDDTLFHNKEHRDV